MSMKQIKDVLALSRAHSIAVGKYGGRQVHVTFQFYKANAKVYSFDTCLGSCRKCDMHWIAIKTALGALGPRVEVIEVGGPEAAAPSEPVELSD